MTRAGCDSGTGRKRHLILETATNETDIRQAQALRYRAFVGGIVADDEAPAKSLLQDIFDDYCEHLIVRDYVTREVVASGRMLTREKSALIGGFRAETMFDTSGLVTVPERCVELDRVCVHPDYQGSAAFKVLWTGISNWLESAGARHVFGTVTVNATDGGRGIQALLDRLLRRFRSIAEHRVRPCTGAAPQPDPDAPPEDGLRLPYVLKRYVELGAKLCGGVALDTAYPVGEVFVVLDRHEASLRATPQPGALSTESGSTLWDLPSRDGGRLELRS